ncbi:hypothetical protein OROHE_003711 [Orobanche hederae]
MDFYDPGETESNMTGVESQMLPAPISDSEEFVLETVFTCVDFPEMEEIVPEIKLPSVDFSDSAAFMSESETNSVDLHINPFSFSDSQQLSSIVNWYEREEGRSEFLMNLRSFVPRLSNFVSDAESEIDNLQELSADDGAQLLPSILNLKIPPFKANLYASEESRIQYLQILRMWVGW